MTDKTLPTAGLATGTTLTTVLTGVLTSITGFVSTPHQEAYKSAIPFICPILAWCVLWIYNRFVEPPVLAGYRGKIKRDLKYLNKMRKDKTLSPRQRKVFDDDYFATHQLMSRMGRDYIEGKIPDVSSPS